MKDFIIQKNKEILFFIIALTLLGFILISFQQFKILNLQTILTIFALSIAFSTGILSIHFNRKTLKQANELNEKTLQQSEKNLKIQLLHEDKKKIQEKKIESISQFFEDCMILNNEQLRLDPMDLSTGPLARNQLMDYQLFTDKLFSKIRSDYYRLFLYVDSDDSILLSSSNLMDTIKVVRNTFKKGFWSYKKTLLNEDLAIAQIRSDYDSITKKQLNKQIKHAKNIMKKSTFLL
ncbi:MAG: hypothetical protein ACLPWD_10830 [Methanobacterium sp.]